MMTLPVIPRRLATAADPLWSDGIHYVRDATVKDKHHMRFVVGAYKTTKALIKRNARTKEEAIQIAAAATASWLQKHPEDRVYLALSTTAEPPTVQKPAVVLQKFATTHFDCTYANPVAQVWECVEMSGIKRPVGRRKAGGKAPEQAPVFHTVGQFAVLLGETPMRDLEGRVRVFPNLAAAEEAAWDCYLNADEEDQFPWRYGHNRVYAGPNVEVHFDKAINGIKKPFSLYLPERNRPVYEDRTVASPAAMAIEDKRGREEAMKLFREPSFEQRTLKFRSIWAAIAEADRREKMLRGETVL